MGAGKTTLGAQLAARLDRPFHDVDREVEEAHGAIWDLFANGARTRSARSRRTSCATCATGRRLPSSRVGGGAVETRGLLEETGAFCRVPRRGRRDRVAARPGQSASARRGRGGVPGAASTSAQPLYREVADATANDLDGAIARGRRDPPRGRHLRMARRARARRRPDRAGRRLDGDGDPRAAGAGRRSATGSSRRTSCRRASRRSRPTSSSGCGAS